jgi:hypothetical protein
MLQAEPFVQLPPTLTIPELKSAPVIDGSLSDSAWEGAAMYPGCISLQGFIIPEIRHTVWLIGYKGDRLYIGMKAPHPHGSYPSANIKTNDDNRLHRLDDHTEIQISPHGRKLATVPGNGFFKIMTNAFGAIHDLHYFNGTPGSENLWSIGGDCKCKIDANTWYMELSVTAASLNLKQLKNKELILQMVHTDGCVSMYYTGLVGNGWLAWGQFPSARMLPNIPAFRINTLGNISEGNLDASFTLNNLNGEENKGVITVEVTDAKGKKLYCDTQSKKVEAGTSTEFKFISPNLPLTPVSLSSKERNQLTINAKFGDTTLYEITMPLIIINEKWKEKYLYPWEKARPKGGEVQASVSYWPYYDVMQLKVDTDFFGVPTKIHEADRVEAVLKSQNGIYDIIRYKLPIKRYRANSVVKLPYSLPEGKYKVIFNLYQGQNKVAEKTVLFSRKKCEFEKNKIGKSREVIPPYTPIRLQTKSKIPLTPNALSKIKSFKIWGRTITLADNGFPQGITLSMPTGTAGSHGHQILARPLSAAITVNGKTLPNSNTGSQIVSSNPDRIEMTGDFENDAAKIKVDSSCEYDGYYQFKMTVEPKGKPVIDSLELVCELAQKSGSPSVIPFPIDTLYIQRSGTSKGLDYFGSFAKTPGVHFESQKLAPTKNTGAWNLGKNWKSFVPIAYIGNGDAGLWFFFWTDRFWKLTDNISAMTIERLSSGNVLVRIRLIAGKEKLDKKRVFKFALQGAPCKPNNPYYREGTKRIAHDTAGYRYYANSVDGFVLDTDEEYNDLRKFIIYGPSKKPYPDKPHRTNGFGSLLLNGWTDYVMMYGSQWMTGLNGKEFDAFGGEWLLNNNFNYDPAMEFAEKWSYGGIPWNTIPKLSPSIVNFTESMIDYFVYYHEKLIEKSGFNGTWWDNCNTGFVYQYNPEYNDFEIVWNMPMRRELTKRLNVMGWEKMRRPVWGMNSQVDMSFCQVFWITEGLFTHCYFGQDPIEHFNGLDQFRSLTRTKSTTLISKPFFFFGDKKVGSLADIRCKNCTNAFLAMHDLPTRFEYGDYTHKLQYYVNLFDAYKCLFAGYWKTQFMIELPPKMKCSVYLNQKMNSAALLILNLDNSEHSIEGITIDLKALGLPVGAKYCLIDLDKNTETFLPMKKNGTKLIIKSEEKILRHQYRAFVLKKIKP